MGKGLPRSMSRGDPLRQEVIKDTLPVRDGVLTVTGGASTAAGFGSLVIGGLPEGNILFLGAVGYFSFAGSGSDANLAADWQGDYAVGTTPADDGTVTNADADIIASTELAAASAEASARTRGSNAAQAVFDNTDGSLEINLNLLTDDDDVTDAEDVDFTVNGELHIAYIMLGDD